LFLRAIYQEKHNGDRTFFAIAKKWVVCESYPNWQRFWFSFGASGSIQFLPPQRPLGGHQGYMHPTASPSLRSPAPLDLHPGQVCNARTSSPSGASGSAAHTGPGGRCQGVSGAMSARVPQRPRAGAGDGRSGPFAPLQPPPCGAGESLCKVVFSPVTHPQTGVRVFFQRSWSPNSWALARRQY
jgi:hypothetical protein